MQQHTTNNNKHSHILVDIHRDSHALTHSTHICTHTWKHVCRSGSKEEDVAKKRSENKLKHAQKQISKKSDEK